MKREFPNGKPLQKIFKHLTVQPFQSQSKISMPDTIEKRLDDEVERKNLISVEVLTKFKAAIF